MVLISCSGLGIMVNQGFVVLGLWFWVLGFWFGVWGVGCGVWVVGFGVEGFGSQGTLLVADFMD